MKNKNYSFINFNNNFHIEFRIELNSLIVGMAVLGLVMYLLYQKDKS